MNMLTESSNIDVEPLYEITQGSEKNLLLFTAVDLGIFDCIETAKTAETIAGELKTDLKLTVKFLNSLVAIGLLAKQNCLYCNTSLASAYLVKGSPFYQGNLLSLMKKGRQQRWSKLGDCLRAGLAVPEEKPKRVFDRGFTLAMAEGAMRGGLQETLKIVSSLPEFSNATKLLDLGGGHGLYSIGFCQINPKLQSFVFDLPPVLEVTREFIARYQMQKKVHTIAGDFTTDDWGEGYDIIFASDALYKPKELLIPVLQKVKDTLNEGGIFITKQWTINKERTGPVTTVLWDLMVSLQNSFPFYTYNDEEFVSILEEAGFSRIEVFDTSTASKPSRIIVSRKELK